MSPNFRRGLSALAVAGAAAILVIQYQAKVRREIQSSREQLAALQAENQSLSERLAQAKKAREPRLPAPPLQATSGMPAPTGELQATNLFARFAKEPPKLTTEQVEAYLKSTGRNASRLLAAYRTSGDPALLTEAM